MEQNKRIVVLNGPRGVGKDTIIEKIISLHPDKYKKIVSYSTRAPRPNEVDGIAYNFVTDKVFLEKVKHGDIYEYTNFHGTYRGSSKSYIDNILSAGFIAIHNTDIIGVRALRNAYPNMVLSIFVTATKETIIKRLEHIKDANIHERLMDYDLRHQHKHECDYIVENNGSLDDTVKMILNILGD